MDVRRKTAALRHGSLPAVCMLVAMAVTQTPAALAQASAHGPSPAEAREVIERLRDALAGISAGSGLDMQQRYDRIAPLVSELHDFDHMTRFLLRRRWDELSSQQQQRIRERFASLSIAQYASRFADLQPGALEIGEVEFSSPDRGNVSATLTAANGDEVSLVYVLHVDEGEWRIINAVADGVSDLALRRAEYSRLLRDEGFEELVDRVEEQIDALFRGEQ